MSRHLSNLRWFRPALAGLLAAGVMLSWAAVPEASPAFARKYQTSCQTCHIAFPKLNSFGEAFRLRGYRMPDETEDMIKEVPVPLGAPGYKRLWPDTVWPSDIPGTIPLAIDTLFTSHSSRTDEEGHIEKISNDFRFPEEVGLITAGTLGETLSFFGEIAFEQEEGDFEVEMEHGQLNFNGPWGSGTAFNVKVGRFAPEITQTMSHGHLLTTGGPAALLQFEPIRAHGGQEVGGHHGAVGISLPHSVSGIEVYGIVGRRFLYSGGLANGIGPGAETADGNDAKDVFGRVAYKFGGLAYDGSNYVASDKNWRETSLAVGAFAYRGDGSGVFVQQAGHHATEFLEDRSFTRAGFDVNVFVGDLNVIAGFVRGRDTLATFAEADHEDGGDEHAEEGDEHGELPELEFEGEQDYTYKTWFIQGDYVFLPWLHGAIRYEWLDPASTRAPEFKRLVPHLTALIRANVKAYVELQRNLGDSTDYVLLTAVRFAF